MEIKRAKEIVIDLMKFHGLESWSFEFRPTKNLFGYCHYSKKLIVLSSILTKMNAEEKVIDTVLHEIAHALASRFAHHGPEWKVVAASIGCSATRCYDKKTITPDRKWLGVCPKCGVVILRHRKRRVSCFRCSPKFDKSLLFVWTDRP